jgi:uncharacterized protein (TIGR02217 family)
VQAAAREQLRQGADHLKVFVSGGVVSQADPLASAQYTNEELAAGVFLYDDVTPGLTPGTGRWDSVTGQPIGTGDGTTTIFQLIRTIGGFAEPIQTPYSADGVSPPPIVYGNGIAYTYATDYSVDNLGRIIFVTAPPSSPVTQITADFSYYWPVRFDDDSIEAENMLQYLWAHKSIKLRQVRL